MGEKIIINNVFTGRFGLSGNNLPHEVINFIKPDSPNDGYYCYITPYGLVNNDINTGDIQTILFVRSSGIPKVIEVMAKATGIRDYYPENIMASGQTEKDKRESINKSLNELNNDHKLIQIQSSPLFKKKTLKDIHNGNKNDFGLYVSFYVEEISVPENPIYITYDNNTANTYGITRIGDKKINNQSMKTYYDKDEESEVYRELEKIINDNSWKLVDNDCDNLTTIDDDSFFKAAMMQDNENCFSNMFYYYLEKYPNFCKEFVTKLLEIKTNSNSFVVKREEKRIDISIEGGDFFAIIENKIHSGINGIEKGGSTNGGYKKDGNGKIISQLSTYYEWAKMKNKNVRCFIFHPKYHDIDIRKFSESDQYKKIDYKTIKEFFGKNNLLIGKDKYYYDFSKALAKHSEATDREFINDMMKRLKERLK